MEMKPYSLDKVAIRMVEEPPLYSSTPVCSPDDAVRLMAETLRSYDREVFCVVNFRNDMSPINMNIVSVGTLNASLAHPREILKSTVLSNASSVMLFHNHPSGNLTPSREDVVITDRMQQLYSLADIQLLDHIIIGNDDLYYSFRENSVMPISENRFRTQPEDLHFEPAVAEQETGSYSAETASSRKESSAAEKKEDRVRAITDQLEAGIADLFSSEKYKAYLSTMAKFHSYSLNNTLLIAMQRPDASLVAGYQTWQRQHGRYVKKGEKGIKIIAPSPYKVKKEREVWDLNTGRVKLDEQGNPVKETIEVEYPAFRVATVFDVSQTEGKELPSLGVRELTGEVEEYRRMFETLEEICPVAVGFEKIPSGAKGYFSMAENRIALREGMSEVQNVKTLVHEMAHQMLHAHENEKPLEERLTAGSREVEAESVAYTVCKHFGIDTSEYSFGYIAGWSSGKETAELKESLGKIRKAASEMITGIEEKLCEKTKASQLEQLPEGTATEKNSVIKQLTVLKDSAGRDLSREKESGIEGVKAESRKERGTRRKPAGRGKRMIREER